MVSDDVIKQEMAPLKDPTPKIVESFAKKVDVDDNPRIYKIIEVQGHPTIVKSDSIYLTREQAKEELFNKQLGV